MYGTGENYHGAMFTQVPYGISENRHILPPTARPPQPTPPMPFDLSTALALAAATVAANNGVNGNNAAVASTNLNMGAQRESEKLGYYQHPPPPNMQTGGEFSPRCYIPPQSNSPAEYMYYPRHSTNASAVNTAYYQTPPWQYQQPPPPPQQQGYDQGVYGTRPADTAAGAAYNGRVEMNGSPYMMVPNGNAATGPIGGMFEDLVDRFNCVNLNDAATVAQQSFAAFAMPNDAALFNAQWQQQLVGKDRGAINRCFGGRFGGNYHGAGDISAFNGGNMELQPHEQQPPEPRAWAKIAGVKSSPGGGMNWTPAGSVNRLPQYDHVVSPLDNGLCLGDLGSAGNFGNMAPFRRGPHRPRVQKTGEGPAPRAPRGVIRDGVYERIVEHEAVASIHTDPPATTNELQQLPPSKGASETGSAVRDRLVRQINPTALVVNGDSTNSSARFFVIKSFSEDDIHRSIKYSIWCSTEAGNKKLNSAYADGCGGGGGAISSTQSPPSPIYLFFSVNGSGHFCGVAEMTSGVDYTTRAGVWAQDKWQGQFSVKWIYVKDVPNMVLRHIHLETNDNKPVTHSRDTTEVPLEQGQQIVEIFAKYKNATSILDDFEYYEQREHQELNRRETAGKR